MIWNWLNNIWKWNKDLKVKKSFETENIQSESELSFSNWKKWFETEKIPFVRGKKIWEGIQSDFKTD